MTAQKNFYYIGFFTALFLYSSLFVSLAYSLSKSEFFAQRYTAKVNFLDVILVDKQPDILPTDQTQTSKPEVTKKDNSPASVKTQTSGVQDLFAAIDAKKLTTAEADKKQSAPSRLNGEGSKSQDNASRLVESLQFKKQTAITATSSSGVYDPFLGKIQDTLYEKWQGTLHTNTEAEAEAEIGIDNRGTFSYSIVNLSYNNDFNLKLRDFLDEMKNEPFPPYEGTGVYKITIKFKDSME